MGRHSTRDVSAPDTHNAFQRPATRVARVFDASVKNTVPHVDATIPVLHGAYMDFQVRRREDSVCCVRAIHVSCRDWAWVLIRAWHVDCRITWRAGRASFCGMDCAVRRLAPHKFFFNHNFVLYLTVSRRLLAPLLHTHTHTISPIYVRSPSTHHTSPSLLLQPMTTFLRFQ